MSSWKPTLLAAPLLIVMSVAVLNDFTRPRPVDAGADDQPVAQPAAQPAAKTEPETKAEPAGKEEPATKAEPAAKTESGLTADDPSAKSESPAKSAATSPAPTQSSSTTLDPKLAAGSTSATSHGASAHDAGPDFWAMAFVFMLSTFLGIGVIRRVSRLLHTPLMSLTNAISAISVVGAIIVAGGEHYPTGIRVLGAIALFASMTNIVSGFLITDRMLKMFKTREGGKA